MEKRKLEKRTFHYLFLAFIIISIIFFIYYLPRTQKVKLVGTEVKKFEMQTKATRDVRFVVASEFKTEETLMYRNEDMFWPPYFKFDSGDLSGKVMNLEENNPNAVVLATYYGWRMPIFSLYPNITDIEIVNPGYTHMPWFNVIFLTLFIIIISIIYIKIKNKIKDNT